MHGNRRRPYIAAVTIVTDGKRKRKALGYYEKQQDALAALSEYHNQPYDVSARDVTLHDFFEKWIEYRKGKDKGHEANKSYLTIFNRHCISLHKMRFLNIQSIHIQHLVDVAKTPYIAIRIKLLFSLLYKYAALQGLTNNNPARIVETPSKVKSTMHKPFSDEEIEDLWQHTDDEGAQIALIYIYSGMRPSELLNIKREDVHLAERYIVGGMKTAAGRGRTIPIADKILPFVAYYYNNAGEYLMPYRDYKAMQKRWRASACAAVRAHLPHDGRHTCETLLDNARVSKRTIQMIVGHAGQDIDDDIYTHKTRKQLIDAINLI